MRRALGWLMVGGLGACGPRFALDEGGRACGVDPAMYDVPGDLVGHLIRSEDGGASFDHDPPAELVVRAEGTYDLRSGAFAFSESHAPGYWLAELAYDGVGTAYRDGDLDVRMTVTATDAADRVTTADVRWLRLGCDVERTVFDDDGAVLTTEQGTWGSDGYAYTRLYEVEGVVAERTGLLAFDGAFTESTGWRVDDHEYQETVEREPNGRLVTTFDDKQPEVRTQGTVVRRLTGTEEHEVQRERFLLTEDFSYTVGLDGSGSGTVDVERRGTSERCEVAVEDFDCTYTCLDRPPEEC